MKDLEVLKRLQCGAGAVSRLSASFAIWAFLLLPCMAGEPIGVDTKAEEFHEQLKGAMPDKAGDVMDLGCDTEDSGAKCSFILLTFGDGIVGTVFAAAKDAPIEMVRIIAPEDADNMNFTIAAGSVMAVTDPGMPVDKRGEIMVDMVKRLLRGSNETEVDGEQATYRLDLLNGRMFMEVHAQE